MVDRAWGPLPEAEGEFPVRRGKFIDIEAYAAKIDNAVIDNATINAATITDAAITGGTMGSLSITGDLTMAGSSIWTNTAGNYRLELSSAGLSAYNTADSLVNTLSINSIGMNFSDRIYANGVTNLALSGDAFRVEDRLTGIYQTPHDSRFSINTDFANLTTVGGVGDTYDARVGFFFDPDYTGYLGVLPVEFMRFQYVVDNSYGPSYSRSAPQVLLNNNLTYATSPDLAWIGDEDTGLYRSGTDALALGAGGTAYLGAVNTGSAATSGPFIYGVTTTGSAANLYVNTGTGQILVSTSSLKYKDGWQHITNLADVTLPEPIVWEDLQGPHIGFGMEHIQDVLPEAVDGEAYDVRAIVAVLSEKVKRLEAAYDL